MYNLTIFFLYYWELQVSLDLVNDSKAMVLAPGKASVHNLTEAHATSTNNSLYWSMQLHSSF